MTQENFCYSEKSKSNTNSLKSVIDVTVSKIGDIDGNQSGESGVTCDDFEEVDKIVANNNATNDDKAKTENGDKIDDENGDGNESESSYEYEEIEIEVTDSEADSSSDSEEISKNNSNSKKISASERETSMASIRKFFDFFSNVVFGKFFNGESLTT